MKKVLAMLATVWMVIFAAGCGGSNVSGTASDTAAPESQGNQEAVQHNKKILVAYFSWSGNTRKVAEQIHSKVGGDIFMIAPQKPYPKDYNACTDYAKQEKADNARPAIANKLANMDDYDVVFIGYPIWWYDAPMIIDTFLESYNFAGKTIIPFCTSGGSDVVESMGTIKKLAPQAKILPGLTANSAGAIDPWLQGMALLKK